MTYALALALFTVYPALAFGLRSLRQLWRMGAAPGIVGKRIEVVSSWVNWP